MIVDETITVDEDYFELNIAEEMVYIVTDLLKKGVEVFWTENNSQFQKRMFWELLRVLDKINIYGISVLTVGEDEPWKFDNNASIDDISGENYKNFIINLPVAEEAKHIISYVENAQSSAAEKVKAAEADGKEIIDIIKKLEEEKKRIEERRKKMLETFDFSKESVERAERIYNFCLQKLTGE